MHGAESGELASNPMIHQPERGNEKEEENGSVLYFITSLAAQLSYF